MAAGIAHEINTPIQFIGDNLRFIDENILTISRLITTWDETINSGSPLSGEDIQRLKKAKDDADIDYLLGEIPAATKQSLEGVWSELQQLSGR